MRKLLLPIIAFALVLGSCTDDLTSLNENPKGASDVPADPLFSNALVSLGTLNTTPDYNINMFKFMAQYWAATTYADESQYDLSGRNIPSSYWSEMYRNVLNDLKEASAIVEEDETIVNEAIKQNMQAQMEVVNVMAYYQLVTIFGDIPYEEALDPENPAPVFDDQEEVYGKLMTRLDNAISDLDASAAGFNATADVFYGGDVEAWVKFANALKMRMAILLSDHNESAAQTALEAASPNAFDSNADNLALDFTSTPPHTNPIWESVIQSGRNDFVPANTLIDMMNDLNDPRMPIHFTLYNGAYVGGNYGASNDYGDYSHLRGPIIEDDFEGMLLDYSEVEFMRAEALTRGWSADHPTGSSILPGNTLSTAAEHYDEAVAANMIYWSEASASEEITQGDITGYLTNDAPFPVAGNEEDQLKAVAEQKWLAHYPEGLQAWTDWRRLDHPTWRTANNPGAANEDEIPSRFIYPIDEQNLNEENWSAAASNIGGDEVTTRLFWDEFPVTRW